MTPAAPTPDLARRVTAVLRQGDQLIDRAKQLAQQIDRHLAELRRMAARMTTK